MSSDKGSVELIGVTKMFGDFTAVDDMTLTVRPGEFLSLLGPSGCGKTTTLRMLAGFEEATRGVILVSGVEMAGIPPHKRDINTVFQAYALFPHMSVAENVAYGLRQRKVPKAEMAQRVGEALSMVKMTPLANRKPSQLSGGQQQRVALARALVNRPSLLLLDEPLGALDRKLREEMQIELKLLQNQLGITFVFVTHDQGEALSMSDRIAVMLEGRIEQLGDPFSIYEMPASAYVAGFIGQQNFFEGVAGASGKVVSGPGWVVRSSRPDTPALVEGVQALAAVRPETVEVSETAPDQSDNVMKGTLAGVSHLGDVIQFVVSTPGREVLARIPRTRAPRLLPGADVWCSWTPDHAHVFDASQRDLVLVDPAATDSDETAGEG